VNRRAALLVILAASALLLLASRTKKGQQVVATVTDAIASGVLGFRLNNPLNVERGDNWQGLAPEQLDGRFATFIDMPYGIRAWHKIMQTYANAYGIRTVAGIVDRYNPVADGQPSSYKPVVARDVGVDQNTIIDVMNPTIAFKLARSQMRVEIGSVAAALISDDTVREGLRRAGVAI
jgi:hypothetical protein